ncbi:serine protease inhibitor 88Ea-like isoform X2 [Contarinia nasturtii]|uniref:serine protease inhibitor 88Ea-like isoform X2 n=1 Tax=Contarinia nasturtii TaxID=265458 RepID=UPI0012D38DD5|nr:serine protease inhibitor 88Ea-like isoform X2 [Contarinia nasturtii]
MNKAIIISVLVVFFWLPYFTRSETAPISVDKLYYGQRKFCVGLLRAFQKVQPNETLFFSPHSIFRALLLKYLIAEGDVEKLLKKTLQLDWAKSKADVSHAYKLEKLARANCRENQTVEFNSVDKLYFSNQVKLNDTLKEMLIDSIEVLNFESKPEEARCHINKFVEETTKGIIKDLLPPEYITHDTISVLVNAAFFKGDWASPFKKEATKKNFFYKNIHTPVYVEMMEQIGFFNYGVIHELNTQFVEIPYSGENNSVSMYFFLPNAIDEFLENVTSEMLDQVFVDGESQHNTRYSHILA